MSVAEIFKLHGENFFRKKEVSQITPTLYAIMLACLQCILFELLVMLIIHVEKVSHCNNGWD